MSSPQLDSVRLHSGEVNATTTSPTSEDVTRDEAKSRRLLSLMINDLGVSRAEAMVTSDHRAPQHVDLNSLDASRAVNRPGTKEWADAQSQRDALRGWAAAYVKFGDDPVAQGVENINMGQSHRENLKLQLHPGSQRTTRGSSARGSARGGGVIGTRGRGDGSQGRMIVSSGRQEVQLPSMVNVVAPTTRGTHIASAASRGNTGRHNHPQPSATRVPHGYQAPQARTLRAESHRYADPADNTSGSTAPLAAQLRPGATASSVPASTVPLPTSTVPATASTAQMRPRRRERLLSLSDDGVSQGSELEVQAPVDLISYASDLQGIEIRNLSAAVSPLKRSAQPAFDDRGNEVSHFSSDSSEDDTADQMLDNTTVAIMLEVLEDTLKPLRAMDPGLRSMNPIQSIMAELQEKVEHLESIRDTNMASLNTQALARPAQVATDLPGQALARTIASRAIKADFRAAIGELVFGGSLEESIHHSDQFESKLERKREATSKASIGEHNLPQSSSSRGIRIDHDTDEVIQRFGQFNLREVDVRRVAPPEGAVYSVENPLASRHVRGQNAAQMGQREATRPSGGRDIVQMGQREAIRPPSHQAASSPSFQPHPSRAVPIVPEPKIPVAHASEPVRGEARISASKATETSNRTEAKVFGGGVNDSRWSTQAVPVAPIRAPQYAIPDLGTTDHLFKDYKPALREAVDWLRYGGIPTAESSRSEEPGRTRGIRRIEDVDNARAVDASHTKRLTRPASPANIERTSRSGNRDTPPYQAASRPALPGLTQTGQKQSRGPQPPSWLQGTAADASDPADPGAAARAQYGGGVFGRIPNTSQSANKNQPAGPSRERDVANDPEQPATRRH